MLVCEFLYEIVCIRGNFLYLFALECLNKLLYGS